LLAAGVPLCLLLAIVLLIALLRGVATVMQYSEGGFEWRQVHSERSPDRRHGLSIHKRVAFPANELIDPVIVVRICLFGDSSSEQRVDLEEESDLNPHPRVDWESSRVFVSDLSSRREIRVVIDRRR